MMTDVPLSPGIIPWLCTAVLVARGFPRMPAYSLVVFSLVLLIADARWGETSEGWVSLLAWWVVVGCGAITLAELIRSPRDQAERSLHTYRESMERQRLLVVTELHDTVVRDLTHAVMTAEQAPARASPGRGAGARAGRDDGGGARGGGADAARAARHE